MKRLIIAAALAAATLTAPAFAASDDFQVEIEYSGKKLANRSDAETEYEHIHKQVSERCAAEHASLRRVLSTYGRTVCTRQTMDRAVQSIDNPMLTQVHTERR